MGFIVKYRLYTGQEKTDASTCDTEQEAEDVIKDLMHYGTVESAWKEEK